jgi:hypothetical protein
MIDRRTLKGKLLHEVGPDEYFRIGILVHGVSTEKFESNVSQIIPRIELLIGEGKRHTTVRINRCSPFLLKEESIEANIGGSITSVNSQLFERMIGVEDYYFSPIRENGSSLVFDWVHSSCSNMCKFCFKEYDWTMMDVTGKKLSKDMVDQSIEKNLENIEDFLSSTGIDESKYPVVWLCTGTSFDYLKERKEHLQIVKMIRNSGYDGSVYMSIVPPQDLIRDEKLAIKVFKQFKDLGLNRINSGMELIDKKFRRQYIKGYKGTLTCDNYCDFLNTATKVFGKEVGSCVLIGLEPHDNSLAGMRRLSKLGIQSVPTIYTSFVTRQLANTIFGTVDDFVQTSLTFKKIVTEYDIEVFESVFGLI